MNFRTEEIQVLIGVVEELKSKVSELDDKLAQLDREYGADSIKEVTRILRSIKELANFSHLDKIAEAVDIAENEVKPVIDGKSGFTKTLHQLLLRVLDFLRTFISEIEKSLKVENVEVIEIPEISIFDDEEIRTLLSAQSESVVRHVRHVESEVQRSEQKELKNLLEKQAGKLPDEFKELFFDYFQEIDEYLKSIEENVLEYEKNKSEELLKNVMRAFHSIKGGTRLMLSFPGQENNPTLRGIAKIAHKMEDEIQNVVKSGQEMNVEKVLKSVDTIKDLMAALLNGRLVVLDEAKEYEKEFESSETEPPKGAYEYVANTTIDVESCGTDKPAVTIELLKDIISQMEDFISAMEQDSQLTTMDFERIAGPIRKGLKTLNLEKCLKVLNELQELIGMKNFNEARSKIEGLQKCLVSKETEEVIEPLTTTVSEEEGVDKDLSIRSSQASAPTFVKVEREKVEFLGNLAGEFITFKNELKHFSRKLEQVDHRLFAEFRNLISKLDKLIFDLQDGTMALRMTPVRELFSRFKRTVRDFAKSLNKKVNLITQGEDVQIDRNIVEILVDPLTHLIRNSIDHGIEFPEERVQKGKPEEGIIQLRAYYSGNFAVIEVEDDGKGIDIEKIRYKAVEKGLLTPEEAYQISDNKLINIIFEPGFSTKDSPTEISGRGYGMDVVKTFVSKLGGDVFVDFEKDKGTRVTLKIPLSLMIVKGLLVEVENERYIIPLDSVRETIKIPTEKLRKHKNIYLTNIRGETVPVVFLETVFNGKEVNLASKNYALEKVPLVVVECSNYVYAIATDRFVEEGEYLIKNIPEEFRLGGLISGATIMGDGSIILIIDPEVLIKMTFNVNP